jgi:hypothetical protein
LAEISGEAYTKETSAVARLWRDAKLTKGAERGGKIPLPKAANGVEAGCKASWISRLREIHAFFVRLAGWMPLS